MADNKQKLQYGFKLFSEDSDNGLSWYSLVPVKPPLSICPRLVAAQQQEQQQQQKPEHACVSSSADRRQPGALLQLHPQRLTHMRCTAEK